MRSIIYEVSLTGQGQNYYTLYRHVHGNGVIPISTFIKNLSIDFDQAMIEARAISGEDEQTDTYTKCLIGNADDANPIVIGADVLRFGKYKNYKISEISGEDKKYVEWIAKGGPVNDMKYGWRNIVEDDYPILQQEAIAIMIGCGDWIERNGKFMSVEKAAKLDWLDSLTMNPDFKEGQRVRDLNLFVLKVNFYNNDFGGSFYVTLHDGVGHIYTIKSASCSVILPDGIYESISQFINSWVIVTGTVKIKNNKMYLQRTKINKK